MGAASGSCLVMALAFGRCGIIIRPVARSVNLTLQFCAGEERGKTTAPARRRAGRITRTGPIQTVTLDLFRLGPWADRAWAFAQMGAARLPMWRSDARFWKLMGAGSGVGFSPRQDTAVWGILATWDDLAAARRGTAAAPYAAFARRARERCGFFMSAFSARGRWSGRAPFEAGPRGPGPVVSITRGTIRPGRARAFWAHNPGVSDVIGADRAVLFKQGLGEMPWLRQATFSIWPDAAAMARFARGSRAHAQAIRAVREQGLFSEDLYALLSLRDATGSWRGAPVSGLLPPDGATAGAGDAAA
jgi:spheroidene monooxygenase